VYGATTGATTAAMATGATIQLILNAKIVRTASGQVMPFGLNNAGKAMSNERENTDAMKEAGKAAAQWVKGFIDRASRSPTPVEAWFSALGWQAARQSADGWLRAVDEALVVTHLGIAEATDDYEVAKKKLAALIQWHVTVALDPAVSEDAQALIDQGRQSAGENRAPSDAATGQEPVATVESWTNGSYHRNYKLTWHKDVEAGTKLYATTFGDNGAKDENVVLIGP